MDFFSVEPAALQRFMTVLGSIIWRIFVIRRSLCKRFDMKKIWIYARVLWTKDLRQQKSKKLLFIEGRMKSKF